MSASVPAGVPSDPVLVREGSILPPNRSGDVTYKQNLWASLEQGQLWIGANVLGLLGQESAYRESECTKTTRDHITEADALRKGEDRYTDRRNLDSFGAFLHIKAEGQIEKEFEGLSVLDIGSGAGKFSDDIRQRAGARATELDFSLDTLRGLEAIFDGRGARVVADGTAMSIKDGSFDRTVSMFSTSVHTDTVVSRVRSLTEQLRVTKEGGRAFVIPLFSNFVSRQQRWFHMQQKRQDPSFFDNDMYYYETVLRKEAAMDFVMIELLRGLVTTERVAFTPILAVQETPGGNLAVDIISGIFDVKTALTAPEARKLETEAATSLTKARFAQLLTQSSPAK